MPSFVEPVTNKKIPNIKVPVRPKIEPLLNLIHPFSLPWKEDVYKKHNWTKKTIDANIKRIKLPVPGEGLPRVIHYCADQGGCAFWRLIFPGDELLANNKAVAMSLWQMVLYPEFYLGIDAVRLQRQCTNIQLDFVKHLRNISNEFKKQGKKGFRIIWEVDDIVFPCTPDTIPEYNLCRLGFDDPKIGATVTEMFKYCDEVTVPSKFMREHYKKHTGFDKISVIPNYVPRYWFDKGEDIDASVDHFKKNIDKPRVLYAGSSTHFDIANMNGYRDDFTHVVDAIIKDLTIDKKYQWVFIGGFPYRLKPFIDNKMIEYHQWTSMTEYPRLLASAKANVMIAPLADNSFNRAKANIKLTEAAAIGVPCVAQNLDCYNSSGWKYLFDNSDQMMEQIANILKDETSYRESVENAREYVGNYWLGDHLDEWVQIYTSEYGAEKRKNTKMFLENNAEQFA